MLKTLRDTRRSRIHTDFSGVVIKALGYSLISLFVLMCIIPFYMMVVASFSTERQLLIHGYRLYVQQPTLFAYQLVFKNPDKVIGSYVLTILLTGIGTSVGLLGTAMAGYALQRPDFRLPQQDQPVYLFHHAVFRGHRRLLPADDPVPAPEEQLSGAAAARPVFAVQYIHHAQFYEEHSPIRLRNRR